MNSKLVAPPIPPASAEAAAEYVRQKHARVENAPAPTPVDVPGENEAAPLGTELPITVSNDAA